MDPILEIKDYHAYFFNRRGTTKAVQGLNLKLFPGETLAIVGESGSGKSVSQLSYLRLIPSPPLKIVQGSVLYQGKDLLSLSKDGLNKIRGNEIAVIFQEPMTSLNPYLRIKTQVIEPLVVHQNISKTEAKKRAIEALEQVGISNAERTMELYPHEFSGGMRQRVMIAMALTTKPKILIADEPTTALDVTVQAQILNLLRDLQKNFGMSIVFITHDLGVVASVAQRVLVLYGGRVLEEGGVDEIFERPAHPYTQALLRSTPRIDKSQSKLPFIPGVPPDLSKPWEGCPFFERCDKRIEICKSVFPKSNPKYQNHLNFCHVEAS